MDYENILFPHLANIGTYRCFLSLQIWYKKNVSEVLILVIYTVRLFPLIP